MAEINPQVDMVGTMEVPEKDKLDEASLTKWMEANVEDFVDVGAEPTNYNSPFKLCSDACFYANLSAPVRLTAGLLKNLKKRPEAAIVNVSSGLALAPSASGAVYCASKAGLRSFSFSLRGQLKDTPIHVIEALPPMVETQMTSKYDDAAKMSPEQCAGAIFDAIRTNRTEVFIGQTRLLRFIQGLSPSLARRILLSR